jgi:hypothetical protein
MRAPNATPRYDLADLVLWAVPLACLFPLRNNDLWWHLASGRAMAAMRSVLHADPFSFTGFMGAWVDNAWLSQLALFGVWSAAGNAGLVLARAALFLAIALALRSYVRASRQPSALLPVLLAWIAFSYGWWELRPSALTGLGLVLLLLVLERIRRTGRGYAFLPFLFLGWASIHPGFLFGLMILSGTAASLWAEPLMPRVRRWTVLPGVRARLSGATVVSALATLVNPYGWRVYEQQLAIAGNASYRALLDEWLPPSVPFLIAAPAAVIAFAWLRGRRVPVAAWVPILGATALATTGVRFQEYVPLVAVPVMFVHLGSLRTAPARLFTGALLAAAIVVGLAPPLSVTVREGTTTADPSDARLASRLARNAIVIALVGTAAMIWASRRRRALPRSRSTWVEAAGSLVVAAMLVRLHAGDHVEPGRYPRACAQAIDPSSRVFNKLSWGGWLIWTARVPTFIDGRGWGQDPFDDYVRAYGPAWREVFASHRIDGALLPRGDALGASLAADPGWTSACADGVSVLWKNHHGGRELVDDSGKAPH